jgi:hypothetical protein
VVIPLESLALAVGVELGGWKGRTPRDIKNSSQERVSILFS